jgi:hypothetical protein
MLLHMLRSPDVVVLLKLLGVPDGWTVRTREAELTIPRAGVHRSLQRLDGAGLYDLTRRRANVAQAEEFLVHAVKYLFPPERGGETRGVPTAWAASPLVDVMAPEAGLPPVWPDPLARDRGLSFAPLHPAAPEIARRDPALAERLFLVDALRGGDARVRGLAADMLGERLTLPVPAE